MEKIKTKTPKEKPVCCGYRVTIDGTFRCDRKPVAAYSWDGAPFRYKGKEGAAVCDEHQFSTFAQSEKYPGLKLIEVIKKPKTIADLKADPRVTDFSDERGSGSGVWAYLVAGFCSDGDTHQVTEDTVAEACSAMASVRPCSCEDCVKEMAGGDGLPMFVKNIRAMKPTEVH